MALNRNYLSWKTLNEQIRNDVAAVNVFGSEHARDRFE